MRNTWIRPSLEEIPLNCEINSYACAEISSSINNNGVTQGLQHDKLSPGGLPSRLSFLSLGTIVGAPFLCAAKGGVR
jgi:coenzyme PQQ precursor peptide PqqA